MLHCDPFRVLYHARGWHKLQSFEWFCLVLKKPNPRESYKESLKEESLMVWNISIDCIDFVWFMSGRLYILPTPLTFRSKQGLLLFVAVNNQKASNNWERKTLAFFTPSVAILQLTKHPFLSKWRTPLQKNGFAHILWWNKQTCRPHFFRKMITTKQRKWFLKIVSPHTSN